MEYAGRRVGHFAIRLIVVVKESSDQRTSSKEKITWGRQV